VGDNIGMYKVFGNSNKFGTVKGYRNIFI
jgi:hypothetical protein